MCKQGLLRLLEPAKYPVCSWKKYCRFDHFDRMQDLSEDQLSRFLKFGRMSDVEKALFKEHYAPLYPDVFAEEEP